MPPCRSLTHQRAPSISMELHRTPPKSNYLLQASLISTRIRYALLKSAEILLGPKNSMSCAKYLPVPPELQIVPESYAEINRASQCSTELHCTNGIELITVDCSEHRDWETLWTSIRYDLNILTVSLINCRPTIKIKIDMFRYLCFAPSKTTRNSFEGRCPRFGGYVYEVLQPFSLKYLLLHSLTNLSKIRRVFRTFSGAFGEDKVEFGKSIELPSIIAVSILKNVCPFRRGYKSKAIERLVLNRVERHHNHCCCSRSPYVDCHNHQ